MSESTWPVKCVYCVSNKYKHRHCINVFFSFILIDLNGFAVFSNAFRCQVLDNVDSFQTKTTHFEYRRPKLLIVAREISLVNIRVLSQFYLFECSAKSKPPNDNHQKDNTENTAYHNRIVSVCIFWLLSIIRIQFYLFDSCKDKIVSISMKSAKDCQWKSFSNQLTTSRFPFPGHSNVRAQHVNPINYSIASIASTWNNLDSLQKPLIFDCALMFHSQCDKIETVFLFCILKLLSVACRLGQSMMCVIFFIAFTRFFNNQENKPK